MVSINANGNVDSITDNGVGQYTVNFDDVLSTEDYASPTSASRYDTSVINNLTLAAPHGQTTGLVKLTCGHPANNANGIFADLTVVHLVAVHS